LDKTNSRNETTKLKETIMKKTISILAIAGLVLALAPAAQAATLTVDNFSFESPDLIAANPTWPTSGAAPDDWTRVVGGNDFSGIEARDGKAGPTDGAQIMFLDDRGGGADSVLLTSNSIGTGADLKALGDTLTITFDARHGFLDGEESTIDSTVTFEAFVSIGGVKDESDNFSTDLGATSLLRTGAVINTETPGKNMDTFTITVATAGMGNTEEVAINFGSSWVSNNGVRTSVDNVRADVIPEPATMTLLAIGGLALIRRRKRA
jgi:hypothetical protein